MMEAEAQPHPLRLLLVDDHERARQALVRRLAAEPLVRVVGHTADVAEAHVLIASHEPHVALIDPRRRDGRGLDAIAAVAGTSHPARPLVAVHASYYDSEEWLRAKSAGAHEWVLKQFDVHALIVRLTDAIRRNLPPERWPNIE
jgi:DNA-binding NarL/FixJ family response regulator